MAYQPPPGPYPVMPTPPVYGAGAPPRPPIPQAALRSYYAILTGAGLSVVSAVLGLAEIGSTIDRTRAQLEVKNPGIWNQDHVNELVHIAVASAIIAAVVDVLLWLWMAWKIRAGRHWARVLSTVFFGIAAVGQLTGGVVTFAGAGDSSARISSTVPQLIVGWISILVGLYAMVMFWHKSNAHFFRPQLAYPPYGQSYYPNQPYPGQPYPQMPMQQGSFMPPPGEPQQQPSDPWSTPPQ